MSHHEFQLICIATMGVIYLVIVGLIEVTSKDKK